MRKFYTVSHLLIGALLVVSTLFQLIAMLGGVVFNLSNNFTETMPWLVPIWAVMLAWLIAAFVLLVIKGDNYPWQPILLAAGVVGALTACVVAFTLRDALADHLIVSGETQGLTTWRLLYRHLSSALVGALITLIAGVRWLEFDIKRRKAEAAAIVPDESTIGLDTFAGDDTPTAPKHKKRSLRKK